MIFALVLIELYAYFITALTNPGYASKPYNDCVELDNES